MYRSKGSVKVGEVNRFEITFTPERDENGSLIHNLDPSESELWVKIKNLEALPLRAAYLAGPYILYVDMRSESYKQDEKCFNTADQPTFESQLKAGQSFYAKLSMHKLQRTYKWYVDVVSQTIFSTNASVQFEIAIGRDRDQLHSPAMFSTNYQVRESPQLHVHKYDTLDLWNSPAPQFQKPLHLVVVTHGLHSNTGADMLYVKERIDAMAKKTGENIIVRGYFGNVCRTERGIKYLGRRLANHILKELAPKDPPPGFPPVRKISFVGHSLGGLVQIFAIATIQSEDPDFFNRIEPMSFVTMATPYLGISNENPGYVKFALDIGFAGRTGQDLGLTWKPSTKKNHKPLLQVLPTGPTHEVLKRFKHRTLYANAVNDGIVPLRTSAILYLDWRALRKAARAKRGTESKKQQIDETESQQEENDDIEASEIPEDAKDGDTAKPEKTELKDSIVKTFSKGSGDFINSVTQPVGALFSFLAPQAGGKRPGKIYKRSQTISQMEGSDGEDSDDGKVHLPRKTSMLESGVSVLLPPLPTQQFIVDPASRPNSIFHDRVYNDEDLPPRQFTRMNSSIQKMEKALTFSSTSPKSSGAQSFSSESGGGESPVSQTGNSDAVVEKAKVEEKIAREWHRDLTWRKVLVELEPDAHNNIVVRRRFANAYGWPVVDHMVENHFGRGRDVPTDLLHKIRNHMRIGKAPGNAAGARRFADRILGTHDQPGPHGVIRNGLKTNPTAGEQKATSDDPDNASQDLSSLRLDTQTPPPPPAEPEHSPPHKPASAPANGPASAVSTESGSTGAAWDFHLNPTAEDEDDGLVYSVGTWIDSLRGIGGYTDSPSKAKGQEQYQILEPSQLTDVEGPGPSL